MSFLGTANANLVVTQAAYGSGGGGGAFSSTKSLDFDGIDDYVSTSIQNATLSTQTWSASVWVNWSALSGNNEAVLSTRQNGIGTSKGIDLYMTGSTTLRARVYVGNGGYADITTIIPAIDTWYHAVITFASNTLKLYFDGVLIGSSISVYTPSTNPLFIGKWGNGNEFHSGLIDEVGIFDIELTQENITEIYNSGTPTDLSLLATPPTNWFRMGENSTFSSPQILMPENTNKDKVSNYSMEFDGVNDYISTGLSSDVIIDFRNPWTVSWWAKWTYTASFDCFWQFGSTTGDIVYVNAWINGTNIGWSHSHASSVTVNYNLGGTLNDGNWHNFVLTGTGASTNGTLYIDGVLNTETPTTTGGIAATATMNNIGRGYGTTGRFFDGNIDELAIFNSAKAIGDIWDGTGKPTDLTEESGLVGYWKMGEEAIFNSTNWLLPNKAQDVFSRYSMDFDGVR